MVNASTILNKEAMERISNSNYSYLEIYEGDKSNIIGTIKTKSLIEATNEKFIGKKIGQLANVKPCLIVEGDTNLMEMLTFKQCSYTSCWDSWFSST